MSDPQKYTLEETRVRQFHTNLINSGQFDVSSIGTEDEFVKRLDGNPDRLTQFRLNVIESGVLSPSDLGGSETEFIQKFLKKNDSPNTSSKNSGTTQKESSKPKPTVSTSEPDKLDINFYDYYNETTGEGGSAHIASSYKNKHLADHRFDEAVRVVEAQTDKDMQEASNIIAKRRKEIDLTADEKTVKAQTDALEEELEAKLNPNKRKGTTVRIREQLAHGLKDAFVGDFNDHLTANKATMYDALVLNPDLIEEWKDPYKRKIQGEVMDAAIAEVESEFNSVVIDNENKNYIQPKKEEYMKRGYSEQDAIDLVLNEYEVEQRKYFEANMHGKTILRYRIQNQIDQLAAEKPDDWEEQVYALQEKLEGMGPTMYDEQGRRVILPEVEEEAAYQLEVNKKIDEIIETQPNFKESLNMMYDETFKVYKNLDRQLRQINLAEYESPMYQMGGAAQGHTVVPAERKRYWNLNRRMDDVKVRLDALGQMVFANENIGLTDKSQAKGYYKETYFDAIREANYKLFMGGKATQAEKVAEFGEIMADAGYQMTEEEMENIAPDMKDMLAESAGYMTDFVGKVMLAEVGLGVSGITPAVSHFAKMRKFRNLRKAVSAGKGTSQRFTTLALNNLEQSVIKAGMNEVRFQFAGAETGHGAAFHYVDNAIGKVVPVLMKRGNKHLAILANSLARNPMTMTASMEIVAGASGALHALANNKIVSEEMKAMFGDLNEVEKRIAVELATGMIFGFGEAVKAQSKGIFQYYSADYITRLQVKAIKNGRFDVAAELANVKFKILEADMPGRTAKNLQKKAKYLLENGVDPKMIYSSNKAVKGRGNRLKKKEVNEQFDLLAREKPELYDQVLGEGSLEAIRAKAQILKKAGVDIEGHSPGNIEILYAQHLTGPKAVKVRKQTELYEVAQRRKQGKEIAKKLKEENIGEGWSESTDAEMKIRKEKQMKRSNEEREFMMSYRRARRDVSKERVGQWGEKYKRAVQGDWTTSEAPVLTAQMITTVGEALGVLKTAGLQGGTHYKKLKAAERVLNESLAEGKAMSNKQADSVMQRITDSRNAFTSAALRESIQNRIRLPKKTSVNRLDPVGLDPKVSYLMKVIDRMFNKPVAEETVRTGSEKEVIAAEKKLAEFKMTENQAKEMLSAAEKDPHLHDQGALEIYKATEAAIKNGATHKDAMARREELRRNAEERTLTESEMIEYELLGFADGSKMSLYQLTEGTRALRSLLNEGMSEFKARQEHDQIRHGLQRYEAVKYIDPKSVNDAAMMIEPNLTGLNLIQKAAKGARSWTESFPTMMEWLMSRTPGRKAMEGPLHAYSDAVLKAGLDKHSEIGYFIKEMIDQQIQIFGSPKKAEAAFKKWREVHDFEIMRRHPDHPELEGVLTPERMSLQDALTISSYARQLDQAATFHARGWSPETLLAFENQITEIGGKEALMWRDAVVQGIMPRIWSRINSRYKIDIGTDLSLIENYFPVARKYDAKSGNGDPFILHNDPLENIKSTHTSSSKERNPDQVNWYRVSAEGNDLAFNDMFYRYLDHGMQYVHYQGVVKDLNAVFRNPDVKTVIDDGFTKETNKVIDAMINDIARGKLSTDGRASAADKARARYVRAALGLNPLLLPKQLMSVNAYQAELTPEESVRFMQNLIHFDLGVAKMLGASTGVKQRYEKNEWNRDVAIVSKQKAGTAEGKLAKLSSGEGMAKLTPQNFKDNMLIFTKYGDYGIIMFGGQAAYRARKETLLKKGYTEADAHQMAYNTFMRATRRTQQSGAIEDLSYIQKLPGGKFLTQFKNSPLQYLRGEHQSITNLYEGVRSKDAQKIGDALKNLFIYHVVLPQTFHAASNGFYLGEKDKSWLDDPMTLAVLIGGSLSYMPIMGTFLAEGVNKLTTGKSFGPDIGIGEDIVKDIWEVIDMGIDIIQESNDPGTFKISSDDIIKGLDKASKIAGVPFKTPANIVTGTKAYLSNETNDELAFLGYSPYMRGDYSRSDNYGIIHKHLPEYGGTLGEVRDEYEENTNPAQADAAFPTLQKEYMMYDNYGGYNRHVNYIYRDLKPGKEQADYIYELYLKRVEGKRWKARRANVSVKEIMQKAGTEDYYDFEEWVANLNAYGVIDESTMKKVFVMIDEGYESVYEWKQD